MLSISNRAGSTGKLVRPDRRADGRSRCRVPGPQDAARSGGDELSMRLLLKLSTADKQPKKFRDALDSIGLSAGQLKNDIGVDAQGALLNFLQTVEGAPDKMGVLSDLFGAEYADDIAKLVGSLGTYEDALQLVGDKTAYAGSMQAEYEARAATTANNLDATEPGVPVGNRSRHAAAAAAQFGGGKPDRPSSGWIADGVSQLPALWEGVRDWASEFGAAVNDSITQLLGWDPVAPIRAGWQAVRDWMARLRPGRFGSAMHGILRRQ